MSRFNLRLVCWLLLSATLFPFKVQATEKYWQSPKLQTTLVELYTSEGCSSCPPADQWMSGLKQNDRLWKSLVPVTFHVDYWNYLGWRDRYAQAMFSKRQRAHQANGNSRAVYTPGFIVDGKEWRGFFVRRSLPESVGATAGVLSGRLDLSRNRFDVNFAPASSFSKLLTLHITWLGMGVSSSVTSGENVGKQLKHDFVVLNLKTVDGRLSSGTYGWQVPVADNDLKHQETGEQADAIAFWVTEKNSLLPIQAAGGFLGLKPLHK